VVLAVGLTQLMAMAPDVAHYGAVVQAPEWIGIWQARIWKRQFCSDHNGS
jgi:hypothetical protein